MLDDDRIKKGNLYKSLWYSEIDGVDGSMEFLENL